MSLGPLSECQTLCRGVFMTKMQLIHAVANAMSILSTLGLRERGLQSMEGFTWF